MALNGQGTTERIEQKELSEPGGIEPANNALRDQNGLIAGVRRRDFSVPYGNSVFVDYPGVRSFGHKCGHNQLPG